MESSPAFQWYPKDILSSVRVAEMTLEEEGAYRRAIDFCWLHGNLPADPQKLAFVIGKGCSIDVATVVQRMFKKHPNRADRLTHERLDDERLKQRRFSDQRRLAGRKSGESRRLHPNNRSTSVGTTVERKTNSPVSNLQSPSADVQEPLTPLNGGIGEFKIRVGKLKGRKPEERWSYVEEHGLVEVFKRSDVINELAIIENAYCRGQKFLPQSVGKLLEDWTGTLDKARNPQDNPAGGKRPESRQRVEGLTARVVDFTKQEKQP